MKTVAGNQSDFSTGSVAGRILKLAGPIFAAHLINLLYNIADRIYLGKFSDDGAMVLAGVGLVFPIIAMITAVTSLCSFGGAPLFGIARGEGDEIRAGQIMGNCYAMLLMSSGIIMLAGFVFMKPLLYLVGASDATYPYAQNYLSIYLLGTPFAMCGLGMNGFINAQGFGRVGMMTVMLGAIVNAVLDPVFIIFMDMGILGASLSTIIGQFCSAVWVLLFLTGKKPVIRLKRKNIRIRPQIAKKTLALGTAGFTMAITNAGVSSVYNATLQSLGGDVYVSVMTVLHGLQEVIQLPGSALSQGAQPIISYNYGAGRNDRVKKAIRFLAFCTVGVYLFMWALVMLDPAMLIRIFNDDPALIQAGVEATRAYFVVFFLMAFQSIGQAGFVALGKTKQAIFFSFLRKGVFVMPFILLFAYVFKWGANGVFYAEPVSHVLGSVSCFLVFMLTVWPTLKSNKAENLQKMD